MVVFQARLPVAAADDAGSGSSSPRQNLIGFLNRNAGNHFIAGQMSFPDQREFNADTTTLGFPIGMMCNDLFLLDGQANFDPSFFTSSVAHWNAGGLVQVSFMLPNPATGGSAQDGTPVDQAQVIQSGTALNNALNSYLDEFAKVFLQYKALGIPVITRMMWEFDLGIFWWGYPFFDSTQFISLWHYIHDYLTITKGCDNLLWAYAANGGPGPNSLITSMYPGDDYVDIVGVDVYTDTPQNDYPPIFSILRSVAPTKPAAFTEWGSGDPGAVDPNFDAEILINGAKAGTWGPLSYIMAWSGWNWQFYQNASAALSDPIVLNRNNMNRGF